jgi:hypothetical protein
LALEDGVNTPVAVELSNAERYQAIKELQKAEAAAQQDAVGGNA